MVWQLRKFTWIYLLNQIKLNNLKQKTDYLNNNSKGNLFKQNTILHRLKFSTTLPLVVKKQIYGFML